MRLFSRENAAKLGCELLLGGPVGACRLGIGDAALPLSNLSGDRELKSKPLN